MTTGDVRKTKSVRIGSSAGPPHYRYSRDSVERAMTEHFGQAKVTTDNSTGWDHNGKGGYVIPTGIGFVELRTLREAALFVIACSEKKRRLDKLADQDPLGR